MKPYFVLLPAGAFISKLRAANVGRDSSRRSFSRNLKPRRDEFRPTH
jgi:hypothetical protein